MILLSDPPLDRRSDPQYLSADSSQRDAALALTATPRGEEAARLPLWLVKRTEQTPERAAHAAWGTAIPIPPAKQSAPSDKRQPPRQVSTTHGNITSVVLSSLAIVLGLFFFVVWLARRAFPKASAALPTEVLEVLGRSPLASRHNLQLIRLGKRLMLVSVTHDNAATLTEITDTDEVNHLVGLCRESQPGSIAGTFRQVLHQLGTSQATRGRAARATSDDPPFAVSGQPRDR